MHVHKIYLNIMYLYFRKAANIKAASRIKLNLDPGFLYCELKKEFIFRNDNIVFVYF